MKKKILIYILAMILLPAAHIVLFGQSYYSNDETENGYWQVYTDYKTGNTMIQFFDFRHQLLYKETLPGKYVKLTKKNIRRFDKLLNSLTSARLLTSSVKSYDLVADSRTTFRNISELKPGTATAPSYHQTKETNVYVLRQGRLRVILKNPRRELFHITILDDQLRTIHHEVLDEAGYGRWFDVSKLAEGAYKIRIVSPRMKLYYKLSIDDYLGYALEHL